MYIVGHTPPGVDDRESGAAMLSERHNTKYLQLIRLYSDIIRGQFFGHWHSDTFRVVYSDTGTCICLVPSCWQYQQAWRLNAANQPRWSDRCAGIVSHPKLCSAFYDTRFSKWLFLFLFQFRAHSRILHLLHATFLFRPIFLFRVSNLTTRIFFFFFARGNI